MLLQAINARTNRTDLKERIISEIIQNKAQYSFSSPEEYDSSADKAFDAVLNDYDEKTRSQLASLRADLIEQNDKNAKLLKEDYLEKTQATIWAEQEKTVLLLSEKRAKEKTRFFSFISRNSWIIYIVGGIILICGILAWVLEWEPVYSFGMKIIPEKIKTNPSLFAVLWTVFSAAVSCIAAGLIKLLGLLGGPQRIKRLKEKFYRKGIEEIRHSIDPKESE